NSPVLVRIIVPAARVGSARDRASPSLVVIEDPLQRGNASIVHIWSPQGHVAQRRRFEFADVLRFLGVFVNPQVWPGIRKRARQVIEAGVMEWRRKIIASLGHSNVGEVESAMTAEAARYGVVEEQKLPALGGI